MLNSRKTRSLESTRLRNFAENFTQKRGGQVSKMPNQCLSPDKISTAMSILVKIKNAKDIC
jgi:hypothetical protein